VCKSESESEHQGTSPRALSLRCVGRSSCKNSGRVGGVALGCTTLQCLVNREYILLKSPLVSSRRTRPRAKTWPRVEHFHMLGWIWAWAFCYSSLPCLGTITRLRRAVETAPAFEKTNRAVLRGLLAIEDQPARQSHCPGAFSDS